ncbi:hypothetical protein DEO72_LG11g1289 [Vigna unguiculata]|uniref:Uncharacterized protein n=1 Tax=Vigna unguiculata TaxID=3917 RepID=A0A4D6NKJ7_VIGUN|nr:hypothetical protein DEO72_LG11g1289 [Vigna unguiculata]
MAANDSRDARRERKSIVSQNISNMMMKSSDTNQEKSIDTEAFSSANTTPLSHYTHFEINGSTTIGSGKDCTSIKITNGPILHKSNINNTGMVQSDCHSGRRKTNLFNTQPLLNTITNNLDKEFVCSSFTPASVDSSAYFEVTYLSSHPMLVQDQDAIAPISKILDFDNNSDEDENDDYIIGHFSSDLYSRAEIQGATTF